jgi:nucleoside-diphosphate-sugar epimerase
MNILFIGGTGNISTDCAALLAQRGHRISVLTRGRNPSPPPIRALSPTGTIARRCSRPSPTSPSMSSPTSRPTPRMKPAT